MQKTVTLRCTGILRIIIRFFLKRYCSRHEALQLVRFNAKGRPPYIGRSHPLDVFIHVLPFCFSLPEISKQQLLLYKPLNKERITIRNFRYESKIPLKSYFNLIILIRKDTIAS